jgi:hypothetical protein
MINTAIEWAICGGVGLTVGMFAWVVMWAFGILKGER